MPRTATPSTCCCSPKTRQECFDFAAEAFDLADRLQTPVFVMPDLDIGMNHRLCGRFDWDEARKFDRGKVMTAAELEAGKDFGRYLDVDGDGIPFRTYPGTHPTKGSSSPAAPRRTTTRATPRRAPPTPTTWSGCSEVRDRQGSAPQPLQRQRRKPTKYGVIYFGSTSPAMDEALEHLEARGQARSNGCACARSRSIPA